MATISASPSPAGPIDAAEASGLPLAPEVGLPRVAQVLRFDLRQAEFVLRNRRRLGEVFRMNGIVGGRPTITGHPDHARSLFTADSNLVPSLTAESPLRPVLGPNSVLTANGARHMRQRRLLLPPFHGEAIARYEGVIRDACERELDQWRVGRELTLAPRMQAITLDVILAGVFGIEGRPKPGTPEYALRRAVKGILWASTQPLAKVAELMNVGHDEPVGLQRLGLGVLDRATHKIIRARRAQLQDEQRHDILSLLIAARTDEGEAMTDTELRDELLTLVLAGHETTANQLAWTWERLLRTPDAHESLVAAVRDDDDAAGCVERTIVESMRSRPVIPMVGRRPTCPWRLGEYRVDAGQPIAVSILLVHHREDLYPDPFAFRPDRWIDRKPGTYEWIPFGGGTRRCLGAALAMTEQRIVLAEMARRVDLQADDMTPERIQHRNVTMIPARGARAVVVGRSSRLRPRGWSSAHRNGS